MPRVDRLGPPVCIDTDVSGTGKFANLLSLGSRQLFSNSTPNVKALRGVPIASSDTIYPALSTDV
jgi:hypothetical protein